MAAFAASRRAGYVGTSLGVRLTRFRRFRSLNVVYPPVRTLSCYSSGNQLPSSPASISRYRQFECRQISNFVKSTGKPSFLVDTLAIVRKLEAQGVPSKHAEAITSAITEVLSDSIEVLSQSFVSNGQMQKIEIIYESTLAKFKSEVESTQGCHFSLLEHEAEKLKNDVEKLRCELRHEIDNVTAGQRLDLNLEKGRIRDELTSQNSQTCNLTNKLDREIHALRAQLEAAKYDVIKYCIGTLVSISAFTIAVLRILM